MSVNLVNVSNQDLLTYGGEQIDIEQENSTFYFVMRQIENALETITGVNLVTQDPDVYNGGKPEDYPRIIFDAIDAEVERIAFKHETAHDMECRVDLQIEGTYFALNGSGSGRDVLRKGVAEKMESLSFDGLIDVIKTGGEQLFDQSQKYGMFIDTYELRYLYNHNSP